MQDYSHHSPVIIGDYHRELADRIIARNLLSDKFLDFVQENTRPFNELMTYYECAMMEIETKFKVLNAEFSLEYDRNPIEAIKTRIKSKDSLARKIRKLNIAFSLDAIQENIFDIAGVRVICSFVDDIYMLADCLLAQDDVKLVLVKDYIKNPKESGYRSLHLIVEVPIFLHNEKRSMKVEVQLRTIAMDFWASLEHKLQYKKNVNAQEADEIARELRECAEENARLDQRMQEISERIYPGRKPGRSTSALPGGVPHGTRPSVSEVTAAPNGE